MKSFILTSIFLATVCAYGGEFSEMDLAVRVAVQEEYSSEHYEVDLHKDIWGLELVSSEDTNCDFVVQGFAHRPNPEGALDTYLFFVCYHKSVRGGYHAHVLRDELIP